MGWVDAKQAITLKCAGSKNRNDIIEVIIVTYRLNGELLESGNKVGIALWNFKISLPCLRRISTMLFYLLPHCSRSSILLLNQRHTLLTKISIFDTFWRITIFGATWRKAYRIWSSPWKVRELGKIAANTRNHNFSDRLRTSTNSETENYKKLSTLSSWNSKVSPNWKFTKLQISSNFEHFESETDLTILNYSKNMKKLIVLWRGTN